MGTCTDSWRQALGQPSSPLHIIDRFSVHCMLSRSSCKDLLTQLDKNAPSLRIHANLPALHCSLSESKLKSFIKCMNFSLGRPRTTASKPTAGDGAPAKRVNKMERRLMLGSFSIDKVTVEMNCGLLQQDRLASLVVCNIGAEITQRPFDETVEFKVWSVYSLFIMIGTLGVLSC